MLIFIFILSIFYNFAIDGVFNIYCKMRIKFRFKTITHQTILRSCSIYRGSSTKKAFFVKPKECDNRYATVNLKKSNIIIFC